MIIKKVLTAGGVGSTGTSIVYRFVENYTRYEIVNLDKLGATGLLKYY